LIDDIVDRAAAWRNRRAAGRASGVTAYITHGVLSGRRHPHHRLASGTGHRKLDPTDANGCGRPNIRVVSTTGLIGEAFRAPRQRNPYRPVRLIGFIQSFPRQAANENLG
jgi:hypothetical protein